MSTMPPAGRTDAFGLVSESFGQAWQRVGWLLFTGPGATAPNWMRWGLIIMLAGLTAGGGGGGNFGLPGGDASSASGHSLPGGIEWPEIDRAQLIALIVPAVILGLLIALAFAYLFSRFRFVFLEGVIAGEPRIGGVFGRTARPGLRYLGFLLLIGALSAAITAAVLVPFISKLPELEGEPDPMDALTTVLAFLVPALLVLVPLFFISTLLLWFTRQFALPYMWLRGEGVWAAIRSAWRAATTHFGAFLLLFIVYILAAIVAGIAGVIVFCCTCFVWGVPALIAGVLAFVTLAVSPWLFIVTGPVILAAALVVAWIFATLTAPIPIFFRALTLAYLGLVDPEIGRLARGGGAEGPPAMPPGEPAGPPGYPPPAPPPQWTGPGPSDPGI